MRDERTHDEVRIGRIGKPHGIRGEVTIEVFTDLPATRFAVGAVLKVQQVRDDETAFDQLTVENTRWNKKVLLVKFAEVSDRNTAELLRDSELYVRAQDSHDQEEGWYASELIGLDVYQGSRDAIRIGEVIDLINGEAQDLLELRLLDGRDVLIPFVEEIVPEIDEEQGIIIITPPPGLLELNQV
ncbi:16S rRNA processing protein RimM [Enteractinococcus coprophilus]|uniref:Ribosome maturation factor RimM n=1 Tax=Enteractinococcus coprophilus TaxID=1027633 RepID=A0A543AIN1_9MICC|nr:16S rRNA processing protein RimM [Enteractinococcus coprophilus]